MIVLSEVMNQLAEETQHRFGEAGDSEPHLEQIQKGGSGRRYFRITLAGGKTLIAAVYEMDRPENRNFAAIALFMERIGVNAPRILEHDAGLGTIWMQDLGPVDLTELYQTRPWAEVEPLYHQTLDQARHLHERGLAALPGASLVLEKEFTEELYRWEQEYFASHCLRGLGGWKTERADQFLRQPALSQMARALADRPKALVHRDLQSQNVLVREGRVHLIDFQGMRPGLPAYDAASLLYDPYTNLDEQRREELLDYYRGLLPVPERRAFDETFVECAVQRLMQALGAYGNLALNHGLRDYLQYVAPALKDLRTLTLQHPTLSWLAQDLEDLSSAASALPHR